MTVSADSNVVDLRRGPGRPKGVPNKASGKVKELAQRHGRKAIRQLYLLMTKSESETVRLKAAEAMLDRAYGKPVTTAQLTGAGGGPIQSQAMVLDISARVADVFGTAAKTDDVANKLGDDEMEAIMSVNFLAASRDAAMALPPAGDPAPPEPSYPAAAPSPAPLSQARHDDLVHTPELAPSPAEPATPDVPGTLEVGHEINLGPFTIRCRRPQRAGLPPCLEALDRHGMFLRNVTSVKAGIRFLHEKFPETRDEAVEIRQTPSAHHTSHHGADQRRPSDPLPQVLNRRR